MKNNETLRLKILEKAKAEQIEYIEKLKQLTPVEILECAYEYVIKEELLIFLEHETFENEEDLAALSKMEYPLSTIYLEWLGHDISFMDALRQSIHITAKSNQYKINEDDEMEM